jgi:hypothetical protein
MLFRTSIQAVSRIMRMLITVTTLSMLLMACGGGVESPTTEPIPPTATPQPTSSLSLGSVVFAQSLDGDGVPEQLAAEIPRSAGVIVAGIEVQHVQPGTTFSAGWTIDGNPVPGIDAVVSLDEGANNGWVTFSLTWEGQALWPVGTLSITVTANSGETATGSVQIVST